MIDQRIEEALRTSEPVHNLRGVAENLLANGEERAAILKLFENARQHLRQSGRESDEDAVMDAMDFLVGWCSPHMKLPPEQPASGGRG